MKLDNVQALAPSLIAPQPAPMAPDFRNARMSEGVATDALNRSTADIRQGLLRGTEKADSLMQGSFGADNPGIAGAIKARYSKKFGLQDKEFEMQMDMMSEQAKFDRLSKAAGLVSQELALNEEKRRIKRAKEMAKRQQRGAILGQVLGIGGAIAGVFAGGPAGAAIGYQAGSGIGQTAGGGM